MMSGGLSGATSEKGTGSRHEGRSAVQFMSDGAAEPDCYLACSCLALVSCFFDSCFLRWLRWRRAALVMDGSEESRKGGWWFLVCSCIIYCNLSDLEAGKGRAAGILDEGVKNYAAGNESVRLHCHCAI